MEEEGRKKGEILERERRSGRSSGQAGGQQEEEEGS